jgi:hypothetical protein
MPLKRVELPHPSERTAEQLAEGLSYQERVEAEREQIRAVMRERIALGLPVPLSRLSHGVAVTPPRMTVRVPHEKRIWTKEDFINTDGPVAGLPGDIQVLPRTRHKPPESKSE